MQKACGRAEEGAVVLKAGYHILCVPFSKSDLTLMAAT